MNQYEAIAELELRIMDNKGNVIKKYVTEQTDNEYVAFYWGYTDAVAIEASLVESYKKALADITDQIQKDHDYLLARLK